VFQKIGPRTQIRRGLSGAISSASFTSGKIWPTNAFAHTWSLRFMKARKPRHEIMPTLASTNVGSFSIVILNSSIAVLRFLLQLFWINGIVEPVDGPPPLSKPAPVPDARRKFFVFKKRF